MATAVLVTDSPALARSVQEELTRQLPQLPREEIAQASLRQNGKIILVHTIEEEVEISKPNAPQHLELCVDNPFDYLSQVRHAGSVFLGRYCPEAVGDYFAGPNHTLPTGGAARFMSPLGVDDFVKRSQVTCYTADALRADTAKIAAFARQEGLEAHARSPELRFFS